MSEKREKVEQPKNSETARRIEQLKSDEQRYEVVFNELPDFVKALKKLFEENFPDQPDAYKHVPELQELMGSGMDDRASQPSDEVLETVRYQIDAFLDGFED